VETLCVQISCDTVPFTPPPLSSDISVGGVEETGDFTGGPGAEQSRSKREISQKRKLSEELQEKEMKAINNASWLLLKFIVFFIISLLKKRTSAFQKPLN
jgi:hypothetical protein